MGITYIDNDSVLSIWKPVFCLYYKITVTYSIHFQTFTLRPLTSPIVFFTP